MTSARESGGSASGARGGDPLKPESESDSPGRRPRRSERHDGPLLDLKGVGRVFQHGELEVRALRDATFQLNAGEYLSIFGPSGSGKSTLLNVIALLDRHTSGAYRFEGTDVSDLSESRRTSLRAHRIGFVFQSFHLMANRTVSENVMMSMLYNRVPRSQRGSLAVEALERARISHRAEFAPSQLSGGEQQRAAIARAIAARPSLLLCDEPTGNLDSATSQSILELFTRLNAGGLTIVIVTHDALVRSYTNRAIYLEDGAIVGSEATAGAIVGSKPTDGATSAIETARL